MGRREHLPRWERERLAVGAWARLDGRLGGPGSLVEVEVRPQPVVDWGGGGEGRFWAKRGEGGAISMQGVM